MKKSLLVLDLESTCYERGKEPPNFFSEIIEIGAVLLNLETLKLEWDFQAIVKPTLHPLLSDFCRQLTTITQEEIEKGIPLVEAFENLKSKLKNENYIFASWGFYDQRQIQRNCTKFQIPYPFGPEHISLKHEFGKWMKTKPMGMAGALKMLQLPLLGTHHRGLDDARNISSIAVAMIQRGWSNPLL